ncbi:phosphoribosyltransferase domain-containing protein [Nissabacter sp. SGAir0207]|uniref:phosphoribosyltransferase domain-containing protein n=1 Tax=Nissabacter sp. SGAir0207 TaxID=2126321 RepID=UPI0010CCC469|nr:phosphoribosyltransferase domain-containing protein [Nissabacter sp. SGAir0207]QCR38530.1 adenine/guanine phosphoribosyltransferase [Nissabacter sp. SGAir0207]
MRNAHGHEEHLEASLPAGKMSLDLFCQPGWSADTLFSMAQRRNPRRAFLFVSKVLGRHIPCPPRLMRKAFSDLADQIPTNLPGPLLVMGMAETAVGLAAGVHAALRARGEQAILLTTTRHPLGGDLLCRFEEEHSHATAHLVHQPTHPALREQVQQARTLVMVDDEATTGKTFLNLYRALHDAGLTQLRQVVTATLTDWSANALGGQIALPVSAVSLATGRWRWTPASTPVVLDAPQVNITARGSQPLNGLADRWGRMGVDEVERLLHLPAPCPGERILVLGSGEYVWQPFLLAEWLENQGAQVKFGSTTRSPVSPGLAIEQAMSFQDHYGLGVPMYLYNVDPAAYDRVILCTETPASAWDPAFLVRFPHLHIHEG